MKSAVKIEKSNNSKAAANHISPRPHSVAPNFIVQAKLQVGEPDDEYEREADRVADTVMRMPEPFIRSQTINEEEEPIQTKLRDPVILKYQNGHKLVSKKEKSNSSKNIAPWSPLKVNNIKHKNLIQRSVDYLAQLTAQQSAPFLAAFDSTVTQVETSLVGVTGQAADDIRASMARARTLRSAGRVTIWQVSNHLAYASYDNASGELRLHDRGNISNATERGLVIHEAIHALHASKYPQISRLYGQLLAAGGTPDRRIATILLQFKAWTEYWAYRRSFEHSNIIDPQETWTGHTYAIIVEAVRAAIERVVEHTGSAFTPWTWNPPARIPGVRRRR